MTIYLSRTDHLWIEALFWGAIVAFGFAVLLNRLATRANLPVQGNWLRKFDTRQYRTSTTLGWLMVAATVMLVAYMMF